MRDHIQFAKLCDEKTVVALHTVHGSISTLEDHFTNLLLTPAMKRHVKSVRMRYGQSLDEQKRLNEQKRKKRKGVQLSIREAERKKKSKVDTGIDILDKEADDLAKPAEAKHDFTLLTKSNALRLNVAQQSQEIP